MCVCVCVCVCVCLRQGLREGNCLGVSKNGTASIWLKEGSN